MVVRTWVRTSFAQINGGWHRQKNPVLAGAWGCEVGLLPDIVRVR